jgi:phage terminase large subunit-like protein
VARPKVTHDDILLEQLKALGPVATFKWHPQQVVALRAATDIIAVIGGNRSGKSKVGEGILSRFVRREGPIYKRLRWSPTQIAEGQRPLEIWVAPQTDEKAKSLWEPRLLKALEGLTNLRYVQSPHRYFEWTDEFGGGKLWLKSQEQGFTAFESNDVDLVLFDEEPLDRRVYASAKMRLSTTNGVCALTFTPLSGMTWTFDELFAPIAEKAEYQIGDRAWRRGNELTVVQMGMADNPEAVAGGGVARLLADTGMTEAEKSARLYGTYGFTEGLLIPQFAALKTDQESIYLLEGLPADRPYRWILTADPNKRHGALLTAMDPDGNRYYCAEHYAESLPDSEHAVAYRAMIAQFRRWGCSEDTLEAFADPGGAGSQAIINLAETGFFAAPIPKDPGSVSASIKRLRRAAHIDPRRQHPVTKKPGAPAVYFLRSLESLWKSGGTHYRESRLLWEFRQYRQKENAAPDTPVKRDDDLVDCARYVELAHPEGPQPFTFDPDAAAKKKLDPLSRLETDRFDRMVEKLGRNPTLAKLGLA